MMSKIELLGVEETDLYVKLEPFEKPGGEDKVHWDLTTSGPCYSPYLVKVTHYPTTTEKPMLEFRGVNLTEPNDEFGPNENEDYAVDPREVKHVYIYHPTTLEGIDTNSAECYAILFLSDEYSEQYGPLDTSLDLLAQARGGPKWPQSAGALYLLDKKLNDLQERENELAQKRTNLLQKLETFFDEVDLSRRSELQQLLKEFAK